MRSRWLATAFPLFLPAILTSYACGLDDSVITPQPNMSANDASIDGTTSGSDATSGGGDATRPDANSFDGGSDAPITTPPTLVYASTTTDLFSLDVVTTTLTHLAAFTVCSNNTNDIAVDSTGQLYINEKSDAIYRLALNGACSGRDVLSEGDLIGDNLKITARNAGTPLITLIDTSHEDYFSVDPASTPNANVVKITNNLFSVASPKGDIACAASGTCWTTLDHQHCSAGSSSSCLFSFNADGSGTPISLGSIGVQPEGLAYANGFLYSFADDGTIAKISLSGAGSPLATVVAVVLASGTTQPAAWSGAGSSSAYK